VFVPGRHSVSESVNVKIAVARSNRQRERDGHRRSIKGGSFHVPTLCRRRVHELDFMQSHRRQLTMPVSQRLAQAWRLPHIDWVIG
jgi:hypothetical protein